MLSDIKIFYVNVGRFMAKNSFLLNYIIFKVELLLKGLNSFVAQIITQMSEIVIINIFNVFDKILCYLHGKNASIKNVAFSGNCMT